VKGDLDRDDPTVARLVEKQMRLQEWLRTRRPDPAATVAFGVHPFVALSRSVGCGGSHIAARLGERLRWPVFDRELLLFMAEDDDTRRQLYASLDERDIGWLEETARTIGQGDFVRHDYFRRLTETILTLARQGSAVFLGRGCNLILPRERGLRVRLTASQDYCLRHYADRHHLSRDEADAQISRIEKERNDFIRRHFGADQNAPGHHDLTIHLDGFNLEQVLDLIIFALRGRGFIS
jgi:hypothetical protein